MHERPKQFNGFNAFNANSKQETLADQFMQSPGLTTIGDSPYGKSYNIAPISFDNRTQKPVRLEFGNEPKRVNIAPEKDPEEEDLEQIRLLLQSTQDEVDRIIQSSSAVNEVY